MRGGTQQPQTAESGSTLEMMIAVDDGKDCVVEDTFAHPPNTSRYCQHLLRATSKAHIHVGGGDGGVDVGLPF